MLHAIYAATATDLVDAENVLLYNVGTSSFRHLMTSGVRFERGFTIPTPPVIVLRAGPLHYQRYTLARQDAGYEHWQSGHVVARFDPVKIDRINKPGPIFTAIRRTAGPPTLPLATPTRFGLRLSLSGPRGHEPLAGLIKPLLDGVICAYHHHNGRDLDELTERLHRAGLGPATHLFSELQDERWQVLGSRRLVKPFREGVQWNPADDACLAAEVHLQPQPHNPPWQLSGSLFEIGEPSGVVGPLMHR